MAAEREPKPTIGRIVTYRTRNGIDIPAIITAVIDDTTVHLEQFAPPGVAKDAVSFQWGVPLAPKQGAEFEFDATWRWPERV